MVSTRIGSLALVQDTLRDVSQSQVKLAELQNQISSGYKSQTFQGLSGSVESFTQVTNHMNRAAQFNINNQLNIAKLETADVALTNITSIADQMKNLIIGTNGSNMGTNNLPQIMEDLLNAFAGELNVSFNGNYLFGGTDTDKAPVPSTTVGNTVIGTPDDNYYVGSKQDVIVRADERNDTPFPVRADHLAFQRIYAAAKQAISASVNKNPDQILEAQQLIQDAQKDLIGLRSKVGGAVLNIKAVDDRLKQMTTYWKQLADDVSKTDIVAASTEVSSYQAILQATFQVYARLSQLRLSDYLK